MQLFLLTLAAMLFFAANSVLCRLALLETGMAPEAYTFVRLLAGSCMLAGIMLFRRKSVLRSGSWPAALALFSYMAFFSWGYVGISTAAGTLIIAFAVQSSMLFLGISRGEYPTRRQYGGIVLAMGGLVCLLLPGLSAPPLRDSFLMLISGASWGVYCFCGRKNSDPAAATAGNFLRALPLALLVLAASMAQTGLTTLTTDSATSLASVGFAPAGVAEALHSVSNAAYGAAPGVLLGLAYAVAAGAVASALGYIIWYAVVPHFSLAKSAVVQLSVPVFTAVGGLLFVGEPIDARMAGSSLLILGGIFIAMVGRTPRP